MLYFPFGHCSDWCFVFPLFFALCRVYLHLFRTKCVLLEQALLRLAHFHYNVQYMFFVSTIFRCKCLSIPHFSWSVCETCVFFPEHIVAYRLFIDHIAFNNLYSSQVFFVQQLIHRNIHTNWNLSMKFKWKMHNFAGKYVQRKFNFYSIYFITKHINVLHLLWM